MDLELGLLPRKPNELYEKLGAVAPTRRDGTPRGEDMNIYFQQNHQRVFGTYRLRDAAARDAVTTAVEVGYRAFDTAQMYANEDAVGQALRESGIPREALCITTKVHPDNFGVDDFLPSVEASLAALHTDYVDVLLVHWPPIGGDIRPSLELLGRARERGFARHIGVSNYNAQMMRDAKTICDAPIVTNQVELHPLLNQDALLAAATKTGIPLSAHSPLVRGKVFEHAVFAEIGAGYGKSAAQVVLRWILQKGVVPIAMSSNPKNMRANYDIMDFTLSSVDMDRIDRMTATGYRYVTVDRAPWAPRWD